MSLPLYAGDHGTDVTMYLARQDALGLLRMASLEDAAPVPSVAAGLLNVPMLSLLFSERVVLEGASGARPSASHKRRTVCMSVCHELSGPSHDASSGARSHTARGRWLLSRWPVGPGIGASVSRGCVGEGSGVQWCSAA